jgi:enamine deaminase RidA (YjgF/YER057c/UK114 family)
VETAAPRESIVRSQATYDAWHFAEATRVGNVIWVSGQRGVNADNTISDDPAEQARVTLRNLIGTVELAGGAAEDIVSITSYHVDMADFAGFRAVMAEFIPAPYPAWTAVGVTALADPRMRVEVAAVAVAGSGKGARVRS